MQLQERELSAANHTEIKNACCDMSPVFITRVEKHMPEAAITFDLRSNDLRSNDLSVCLTGTGRRSCFATDRCHVLKALSVAVNKDITL